MFALFKRKKLTEQDIWPMFQVLQHQARKPVFYTDLAVPDTTEGRYDLLLVHLFLMLHRLKSEEGGFGDKTAQDLFDAVFKHIDEGYREIGIGDMGVPKRMKKLMLAFNGRMHAYEEALEKGQEALADVLDRNLYNLVHFENDAVLKTMANYIHENAQYLQSLTFEDIIGATFEFKEPKP